MKNKLIIIGGGSLLNVSAEIVFLSKKINLVGYISEKKTPYKNIYNIKYLGSMNDISNKQIEKFEFILAVGDNFLRYKIYKKLLKKFNKISFVNLIHPSVIISKNTKIGKGNIICGNSNININTQIGNFCILNSRNSIDHDNEISDFVGTGPGVTTGGHVVINKFSFLGINSSIKNNIIINENSIVAGGSFLRKNTKKNSIYSGVPAKFLKERLVGEKYL